MPLDVEVRAQIESVIASNKVVLFMKGTPQQPQCGFSATVIGILNNVVADYATADVLADPGIRDGIKEYSQWPTIPQLYIDNEFVGGCDVVQQMYTSGDLHRALGLEPVEQKVPEITITDSAAAAIREVADGQADTAVHLTVDAGWNHQFSLGPVKGHEIKVTSNGIEVHFDLDSAQRADGLVVDMTDSPEGAGFSISNPNAPSSGG
jgi:monothiol glutaredoxin